MSLLVVGSVALDSVETPFGKRDEMLGGSAVYFALSANHFAPVKIVGVVGDDFPEDAIALLRERNVDLGGLETRSGGTFRWGGRYSEDMNERDTLFTELNVFEEFRPVIPNEARSADYVFLGNIMPSLQLNVLDQMADTRFVAMDTMNIWIGGAKEELLDVLGRVDALMINDSEAKQLSGKSNLVKAATAIQEMGCPTVVVKKGEHGCFLVCENECFAAPAFPLETVVDPTGAGDTFAGGFMGHVARTGSSEHQILREAVVYGTVMASFAVESFGVECLLSLTENMIEERYNEFKKLVSF
jgi:sugar/nucleoside kinase (ribokinase family)